MGRELQKSLQKWIYLCVRVSAGVFDGSARVRSQLRSWGSSPWGLGVQHEMGLSSRQVGGRSGVVGKGQAAAPAPVRWRGAPVQGMQVLK